MNLLNLGEAQFEPEREQFKNRPAELFYNKNIHFFSQSFPGFLQFGTCRVLKAQMSFAFLDLVKMAELMHDDWIHSHHYYCTVTAKNVILKNKNFELNLSVKVQV